MVTRGAASAVPSSTASARCSWTAASRRRPTAGSRSAPGARSAAGRSSTGPRRCARRRPCATSGGPPASATTSTSTTRRSRRTSASPRTRARATAPTGGWPPASTRSASRGRSSRATSATAATAGRAPSAAGGARSSPCCGGRSRRRASTARRSWTGREVLRVLVESGRATGVVARVPGGEITVRAPMVALAGGSILSPAVLQRSGIAPRRRRPHPAHPPGGRGRGHLRRADGALVRRPAERHERRLRGRRGRVGVPPRGRPDAPRAHRERLPVVGQRRPPRDHGPQCDRIAAFLAIVRDRGTGRVDVGRDGIGHRPLRARAPRSGSCSASRRSSWRGSTGRPARSGSCPLVTPPLDWRRGEPFEPYLDRLKARPIASNRVLLFTAHQMSSCRIGLSPADERGGPRRPGPRRARPVRDGLQRDAQRERREPDALADGAGPPDRDADGADEAARTVTRQAPPRTARGPVRPDRQRRPTGAPASSTTPPDLADGDFAPPAPPLGLGTVRGPPGPLHRRAGGWDSPPHPAPGSPVGRDGPGHRGGHDDATARRAGSGPAPRCSSRTRPAPATGPASWATSRGSRWWWCWPDLRARRVRRQTAPPATWVDARRIGGIVAAMASSRLSCACPRRR